MVLWKQCQRGSLHCLRPRPALKMVVASIEYCTMSIAIDALDGGLILSTIYSEILTSSKCFFPCDTMRRARALWKPSKNCGRSLVGLMVSCQINGWMAVYEQRAVSLSNLWAISPLHTVISSGPPIICIYLHYCWWIPMGKHGPAAASDLNLTQGSKLLMWKWRWIAEWL